LGGLAPTASACSAPGPSALDKPRLAGAIFRDAAHLLGDLAARGPGARFRARHRPAAAAYPGATADRGLFPAAHQSPHPAGRLVQAEAFGRTADVLSSCLSGKRAEADSSSTLSGLYCLVTKAGPGPSRAILEGVSGRLHDSKSNEQPGAGQITHARETGNREP